MMIVPVQNFITIATTNNLNRDKNYK